MAEEAIEFMGRINVSAERMNEMIESFLWLSGKSPGDECH